ncbi:MAG TPA: ATP-binding cassette domain-containing protein [Steroidobacteraceae bacterium]|nr:ATP-binding cassette domain-containing protein [Steroidobacteraceae bacterium]
MSKRRPDSLVKLEHCSLVLDDHIVLDDVSFELRAGERWALIGANGSGKTMLLKMIRGDMWPTPTGRERRTYNFAEKRSGAVGSKQHIAYIGSERQDKYVRYDWNLSVTQIVTTGLFDEDIPLTTPNASQRAKVERMIRRFGLWSLRSRKFLTLSYGQRRLALVARAFASNAAVLLLDEVFNGLDAKAKAQLRKALEAPRQQHAWIITSHRPEELPKSVTHIAVMERGALRKAQDRRSGAEAGVLRHAQDERLQSVATRLRHGRREESKLKRERSTNIPFALSNVQASKRATRSSGWLFRITNADIFRDYRSVIRNLNWTVNRGERWAVQGANGSGKSTLLSLIYGDMHPALGGTIERRGVPRGTHISFWKKRVGWVSPELQADYYLATSLEEIVISGRYSSVGLDNAPTRGDRRAAERWLRFFGIEHLSERGPRQVSYGQMRLALIARAMVNDPELLLLDEPCTGLDGDVREQVLEILQRIASAGTQLIMAVHDSSDIVPAVGYLLRIGKGGRVTMSELARQSGA